MDHRYNRGKSGLPKDSVANVSQVIIIDRGDLRDRSRRLPARTVRAVDDWLRLVLELSNAPG